jgi:mRNA interferase MazF
MAPTSGDLLPSRGEVWWIRADKRRPAIVVQTDAVGDPRIGTFLVVPLTSRTHLEGLPGNVRLHRKATGLTKTSVANVYDVQKVLRIDFLERIARVPVDEMMRLDSGLRLILGL